ncbi:hypothetical protein H3Z83_12555 [Tenacibaculum sp. S7007]|uniref:Uncharacterized protein n=1 Tax=Tenacibaculum pelagium TaxID=2759527 RepID=A0A839ASL5_9FLAO|nr:hypothetical protein [Tenacibaculum pelagium]MBA6157340.1 hypothetical protein [Tenacibaculum pelagium]
MSCNKEDSNIITCDKEPIINNQLLINSTNDNLVINKIELVNDCLKINFSSAGCNDDSMEVELISSSIMESKPPQRRLRLFLNNNENCEALITKEISFNISNLKSTNNEQEVILNIDGYSNNPVLYN